MTNCWARAPRNLSSPGENRVGRVRAVHIGLRWPAIMATFTWQKATRRWCTRWRMAGVAGETLGESHSTKRPPPPRPPLGGARAGRPWATVGRDVPCPRTGETVPQIQIVSSPAVNVGRGVKPKSTHSLTSPFYPRHQDDYLPAGARLALVAPPRR